MLTSQVQPTETILATNKQITPVADITVLPKETRPNFIIILADDLDARLNTIQYMPHLQELLISQGLTINDFIISNPVCCPSRVTILRGQYTHSHEVFGNSPPNGGFEKLYSLGLEESTLGTWLQAAGYNTVFLGKYENGYPLKEDRTYFPPGWTEWYSPARGKPYIGLDYSLNENGNVAPYSPTPDNYLTDVLARRTIDYIQRKSSSMAPFFIYLAPYAPHAPAEPAQRHAAMYPSAQVPRTPSFNEVDVSDKSSDMNSNPPLTTEQIAQLDEHYVKRVQSMQAVDEMILQIMDELQKFGKLDNTYIIFTSDNGYHMGQHRLKEGKGRPYEEDIVVPFVIRGPGVPKGAALDNYLSGNVDIAPTLADLAGIIPPNYVDGRSLVPLIFNNPPAQENWRQAYLLEFFGDAVEAAHQSDDQLIGFGNERYGLLEPPDWDQMQKSNLAPDYVGLRTIQYTFVKYRDGTLELYDLIKDPYELENLAHSADKKMLEHFSSWVTDLSSCHGDQCALIEDKKYP